MNTCDDARRLARAEDVHAVPCTCPAWSVIAADRDGVTVEKSGHDPEALADEVASWAQQEEDRWPDLGLLYMLVPASDAEEFDR